MPLRNFGELLFESKKSLKLPILWTVIFSFPALAILGGYSNNGKIHSIFFALLLLSPALVMFITRPFSKLSIYDKGVAITSILGSKNIPLNLNTDFYIDKKSDAVSGLSVAQHTTIKIVNGSESLKIPSSFKDQDDVIAVFDRFQEHHMLPPAIDKLNQNKSLKFGDIQLSNSKISIKNKVYALSSIEQLTVENGTIRIYLQDKPMLGGANAHMSLENVPNYHTFLIILSQLRLL